MHSNIRLQVGALTLALGALLMAPSAYAAGTLAPASSADAPMRILDHHAEVLIDNGYVRTEVTQTFHNPNANAVEGIYVLPLPLGAALSEMTVVADDHTLYGEVVAREMAQQIYDEQRAAGEQAALATKEGYQRFEFRIASIPADGQVTLTFAYYQVVEIDDGVARYLYPLEEGGTDPEADAFWKQNATVEGTFSVHVTLRSAAPVQDVRIPDFESAATITQVAAGEVDAEVRAQAALDRDFIFYYRLADDLPGRVEVIPYRADEEGPGTFMMVLTPGVDLAPLQAGSDYIFVLDTSGSMLDKLDTLKGAVRNAIASLRTGDRYRIVAFSTNASELTTDWIQVDGEGSDVSLVDALRSDGGTNLHAGMQLAVDRLDSERASCVLLVTDGVANQGFVDGPSFAALLQERDVRVYGFLMGNSGNWPLMELLAEVSGGFYAQVSNADDIGGRMMQAREKMTHAALHDFRVHIDGGAVSELSHHAAKVHHGDQVVIFGRYDEPGEVSFDVEASITGEAHRYGGSFELPALDDRNPELERLWAFAHVRWLEYQSDMQLLDADEAAAATAKLGVDYQLVTDETSMILLSDDDFTRLGIDPQNRDRVRTEEEARMLRAEGAPVDYGVPVDPAFGGASSGSSSGSSYSGGSYSSSSYGDDSYGGGAVGPTDAALLGLLAFGWWRRRRSARAG
jgi:Ca-activated chloride channel family protein